MAVPIYKLNPLEYRVALDVASVWLSPFCPLLLFCEQTALLSEAKQRLQFSLDPPWNSGLWLEPQRFSWQATLRELSTQLPAGARLAVLLSLPLALRLPERCDWLGNSLGEKLNGLKALQLALPQQGFVLEVLYGFHSSQTILINTFAKYTHKLGRMALGDRLEFVARMSYSQPLSRAWQATCALILAARL